MKKCISVLLILAVTLCLFTAPCMAARTVTSTATDVSVEIPDNFNIYTKNSLPTSPSQLEDLGCTYDEIKADFNNNGYVFLAHSPVLKCSVFLSEQKTTVSTTIKDLYRLSGSDAVENAGKLLLGEVWETADSVKEIEKDLSLFFKVEINGSDLSKVMYVSVINSVTYTLCLIQTGGAPSENSLTVLENIFQSLDFEIPYNDIQEDITVTKGQMALIIIAAVVGLSIVALLIISIVKDIRKIRNHNQRTDNVKKYKKPLR